MYLLCLSACRSEDDLTHQLGEIIKANLQLKRQVESGASQHILADFMLLLQVSMQHRCEMLILYS